MKQVKSRFVCSRCDAVSLRCPNSKALLPCAREGCAGTHHRESTAAMARDAKAKKELAEFEHVSEARAEKWA